MAGDRRRKRSMLPDAPTSNARVGFGPALGSGARHALKLAEQNMTMTLASVLMSIAWLEGCVNDLIDEILEKRYEGDYPTLALLRQMAVVARLADRETKLTHKIQVLAVCLTGKQLHSGSKLYSDLTLAISIRNLIAHPRMRSFELEHYTTEEGVPSSRPKAMMELTKALTDRRVIQKPDPKVIYSDIAAVQDPKVAAWVYKVARLVLEDILSWLPDHYQKLTGLGVALQWK